MIITDRFVLLSYPRTGSTFVRNVLKRLYGHDGKGIARTLFGRPDPARSSLRELILPIDRTLSALEAGRKSQHGTWSQIPPAERNKPVLSVFRNPFDLIVSGYELAFWKDNPIASTDALEARFPGYPDLSFEDYLAMMDEFGLADVLKRQELRADVGPQTIHFLRFYFRDPDRVIAAMTDNYIDSRRFRSDMAEIRFIHTENLGRELCDFLADAGIPREQTAFILDLPKINIAESRRGKSWQDYFSERRRAEISHRERMLFMLFPEYDG